jgi:glycerol kinase
MPLFLGLDLGTTLATALVVDEQGREVARHAVPLLTRTPRPGCVEQDPLQLVAALEAAAAPLLASHHVTAAGLDNQGESFLLWDASTGAPLTPNIVWQDQRGTDVCLDLATQVDRAWVAQRTGLTLDTYFSAPKLAALLRADASLRAAARAGRVRFGTTDTWLLHHLTGGRLHITDASTASRTLLFNLHTQRWDEDLLALFNVPRAMLPTVVDSGGDLGTLPLAGHHVPLRAMLVDQAAALLGHGCFQPGDAKCTFGTGSFLLVNTGSVPRASSHGMLTTVAWRLQDHVTYALDGGVFCTGAAVAWLAEKLGVTPSVEASAEQARRSCDPEVVVVPAFTGLGAPRWDTHARGAMFGLSLASTADDVVRATLDGIACLVGEVATAMQQDAGAFTSLRVDGGPTRNGYLMQVLASVLNLPVHVSAHPESTALGAARLAQHIATQVPLSELGPQAAAFSVVDPSPDRGPTRALLHRWDAALRGLAAFHSA